MKKLILILLMIVTMLLSLSATSVKVKYVGGVAYLINSAKKQVRVTYNMQIKPGDTIITKDRSFVALVLGDKSVHKITANTEYKVQELVSTAKTRKQTFSLKKGKVFNYISKSVKKSDIKFVTPTAIVGVRGTVFSLMQDKGSTTVFLLEGGVELVNPQMGKKVTLTPNQKGTTAPGKLDVEPMSVQDKEEATEGVPVQVGSVTIEPSEEAEETAAVNVEELKEELKTAINKENQKLGGLEKKNVANESWDRQFNKQIGPDTVRQYFKKKDDKTIVIDTYTVNKDDQHLLGVKLIFSGRTPTLEDYANGVVREISHSTMTLESTVGNNTDRLVYDNDTVNNVKTVTLNEEEGTDLTVDEFDLANDNALNALKHIFPKHLQFTVQSGVQEFRFELYFVDDNKQEFLVDDIDLAQNQIVNGDLATLVRVTPDGNFQGGFTSGQTFDVVMLNDYINVLLQ